MFFSHFAVQRRWCWRFQVSWLPACTRSHIDDDRRDAETFSTLFQFHLCRSISSCQHCRRKSVTRENVNAAVAVSSTPTSPRQHNTLQFPIPPPPFLLL